MSDKKEKNESLGETFAKATLEAAGEAIGGPAGKAAVKIVSVLGKRIITYYFDDTEPDQGSLPPGVVSPDTSTFAVIGLGRCGSRVTAQLARMIAEAKGTTIPAKAANESSFVGSIRQMLQKPKKSETLRLEPVMVIGDVNEATFAEVDGLLGNSPSVQQVLDSIMKIDYRPLARGGCGNIPIFGEFLTRGLLCLPPDGGHGDKNPWVVARNYLLHLCSKESSNTRMAFYIFSAAGGSGSGAAAELMRAQRFAIKQRRGQPDPLIYFTGIAVIPEISSKNANQLRNTGRTIASYLADLNIRLTTDEDYEAEQHFNYSNQINGNGQNDALHLPPWDSLGIISNEVMRLFASTTIDQAHAEGLANQYIAQQIFNLAAAQSQPKEFKQSDSAQSLSNISSAGVQFQGVHLDTADLRAGLRGPFAFGFAAAAKDEIKTLGGIDAMVLRAISLPKSTKVEGRTVLPDLVEGISISPLKHQDYAKLFEPMQAKFKEQQLKEPLDAKDLEKLSETPFFKRCPRIIFVLTSPLDSGVTLEMSTRVATTLSWLMPNLKQARYAIVPGTTAYFSLSIYFESSVMLCYDVSRALANYVRESWKTRSRKLAPQEFTEQFGKYTRDITAPMPDKEVLDWLGPEELYGHNSVDFANQVKTHNTNWRDFVLAAKTITDDRKQILLQHRVEDCMLRPEEVLAALKYVNYVAHVGKPPEVEPPDYS